MTTTISKYCGPTSDQVRIVGEARTEAEATLECVQDAPGDLVYPVEVISEVSDACAKVAESQHNLVLATTSTEAADLVASAQMWARTAGRIKLEADGLFSS